jgi:formate dehydrogenase subunit gamma
VPDQDHSVAKAWDPVTAREIAIEMKGMDGPLLPILHAFVQRFGHITSEAIVLIADVLNLTRADVQGVVSFYHDFRRTPAGRYVVKLCRAEACQAMGSEELASNLEQALGIKFGETTPDDRVTLEAVYCLGNCALSPAVLVNNQLRGRANESLILDMVGGGRP